MTSIVEELRNWVEAHAAELREKHIELEERFPGPDSDHPWKASIGLVYREFLISYTVWERTTLQTTLIVMNGATKKTIVVEDAAPATEQQVRADLDRVVQKLLDDSYNRLEPGPKESLTPYPGPNMSAARYFARGIPALVVAIGYGIYAYDFSWFSVALLVIVGGGSFIYFALEGFLDRWRKSASSGE